MPNRPYHSTHAIVPVNIPEMSKLRLSKVLSKEERARLTLLMLDHVLATLRRARTISSVTVVSADRKISERLRKSGVRFLWEGRKRGLNSAITFAQRKIMLEDNSSVLIIHADLPILDPKDVNNFVRISGRYEVGICPSNDGRGTNALFLKTPNLIPPAFGRESFRKHLNLIHEKSLRHKILRLRGIGFDLDNMKDLEKLIQTSAGNDVSRYLRKKMDQKRQPHASTLRRA